MLLASAPARICLFGEHQDYLGLPIVAAAVTLRVEVRGVPRTDGRFSIDLPDLGDVDAFNPDEAPPPRHARDYLRIGVRVLRSQGWSCAQGHDITVRGAIPMGAGASSSSALCVAWMRFLLEAGHDVRASDAEAVARLAHRVEVLEPGEPGGMMDHFASALGGVIHLDCRDPVRATRLAVRPGAFVLGHSGADKNTLGTLGSVKSGVLQAADALRQRMPDFSLESSSLDEVGSEIARLPEPLGRMLCGTLETRDLTRQGMQLLERGGADLEGLGELLDRQHAVLRERLGVSVPAIDAQLDVARRAGARGGKVNGSGGGGGLFVYAPEHAERVARAIERAGGRAWVQQVGGGVQGGATA